MSFQDQIMRQMGEIGGRLRVKSALNPVLWQCAIVTTPLLLVCILSNYKISFWIGLIISAPVLEVVFGFVFLLIYDRDKLQSEDYQIRKKSLELIQEKGDRFPVLETSIQEIANPETHSLSPSREREVER
jgi:hypothetical protein